MLSKCSKILGANMTLAWIIIGALIIYLVFYFTHGKYLEKRVFRADPSRETPARRLYDGVDYVPANKYVLYGHHFASIAGAGPIVGPAIALAWGWFPTLLWVWFGNTFIGVVHDYLSLASSVRYDGRSIAWISGRLMGKGSHYAFNIYIWLALLLVVAAFAFVVSALFTAVPGAGLAAMLLIVFAVIVGWTMYKTAAGFKASTVLAWSLIILAVLLGFMDQEFWHATETFMKGFAAALGITVQQAWIIILIIYTLIAASLPVWVLLQPRDYINAYILWASLAIGGAAVIVAAIKGFTIHFPMTTALLTANVVGGKPSPFWPTIPLVVACGALSGFHSLVGSGTSSKQLSNELDALLVGYGGMLTEGFLSTMVIACMAGFLYSALLDATFMAKALATPKAVKVIAKAMGVSPENVTGAVYTRFVEKLVTDPATAASYYSAFAGAMKWSIIPYSYAYAVYSAFGWPIPLMAVFGTLWITGFALTSLDTAARLGRFAWQELFIWAREKAPTFYKVIANRWLASIILVLLGGWLAWKGAFLVLWPAFAGMNQLLASLALMTVAVWAIKIQKAPKAGKVLTTAPAVFLWTTVTIALIWFLAVVSLPPIFSAIAAGEPIPATSLAVSIIIGLGLALNLYLFAIWLLTLRRRE